MDDNTFWIKFTKYVFLFLGTVALCTTIYWTVDRCFQGHTVVVSPQTVIHTN